MINKSTFVGQYIDDISKHYKFIKELGSGSFGSVYRVQNKITGNILACKKLNKKKIKNKERFKTEIELLKSTDHPNIVRLYEIYEDLEYIYFIMEECVGGEFFDRLSKRATEDNLYTEKEAAFIFKQLMSSINYLHSHGVSHRDIKPENILFASLEEDSSIKLIDFGLSKVFGNNLKHGMNSVVGTTFYMAPEVIKGKYDERCDVWSAGVILYIMLCGRPPFFASNDVDVMKKIAAKSFHFKYPVWDKISSQAKELIKSILVDADQRPTAQEVLENEWVKLNAPHSSNEILKVEWNQLWEYARLNKIQKSVINFTAFRLKNEETREISKIFNSIDTNSDGVLSLAELMEGVEILNSTNKFKISEAEMEIIFEGIDVDKNGLINYTEFISAICNYNKIVTPKQILEAFSSFDTDKNGKLSQKEIFDVIRPENSEDHEYLMKLFRKYDTNGDGEIDYEEFLEGLNLTDK